MKIGVVTYVRTSNYGAELQGYALQQKLNLMGYDARCLDFDKIEIDRATFMEMAKVAIIKRIKLNPLSAIPQIVTLVCKIVQGRLSSKKAKPKVQIEREDAFEEFWRNEIRHSEYISNEELYTKELGYDVLIAGSDQIWNYTRTSYLDPYFLTFAAKGVKKVSYAASFSISEIPTERESNYKALINNIDVISVREQSGVDIVKKLTSKKAELVIDPTLLLNKKEWMNVASDKYKFDFPYILTYSLNTSSAYWKVVNRHAKRYNLKIVNLRHDFIDNNKDDNRIDIFNAGPREFLYLLANAKLVVTNSFHGTIFSINFNVPFISVMNVVSETNSRIYSITEVLKLKNRVILDSSGDILSDEVDFRESNKILSEMKNDSLKFLLAAIENNAQSM